MRYDIQIDCKNQITKIANLSYASCGAIIFFVLPWLSIPVVITHKGYKTFAEISDG